MILRRYYSRAVIIRNNRVGDACYDDVEEVYIIYAYPLFNSIFWKKTVFSLTGKLVGVPLFSLYFLH